MQTKFIHLPFVASVLLGSAAVTALAPAFAQEERGVAVHSLAVEANGLGAGSVFQFEVQATPRARAAEVEMVGQRITVPLREVQRGVYRGSYTVKPTELIQTHGELAARIRTHDQTMSRTFPFPPNIRALATAGAPAAGIERFVMRPAGRLAPGRELRFRLRGEPGGQAWVDIPGVITGVDLEETRPGVYEGEYTVRRRDNLDAFPRAVATLAHGSKRVTARLQDRGGRDDDAPIISALVPAEGARVSEAGRTRISAKIEDGGHGVDPASIRMRIGGRDVSRDARFADGELRYSENLPAGRHTAELTVRDQAGNTATKSWSFEVVDRAGPPVAIVPPGPLTLQVTSHTSGSTIPSTLLNLQGRTVPHASVRVQIDNVVELAGQIGFVQAIVDQTVQADAAGNFQFTVAPGILPMGRYEVRLISTSGGQTAEQRLTLRRQG